MGIRKGYNKELAFVTFKEKLKTIPAKVIFLEWNELMSVYNATFPDEPHLELAKDVFCFQCFTSLRYSDVKTSRKPTSMTDILPSLPLRRTSR